MDSPIADPYQLDALVDDTDEQGLGKRKRDDDGPPPQQRAKRNRYISIACNECKRRKIKCNGESPCQRCGNLNVPCLYAPNCCGNNFKDSPEYKAMNTHIQSLQDQVDSLFANITALRRAFGQDVPAQDVFDQDHALQRQLAPPQTSMTSFADNGSSDNRPEFRTSTSTTYGFDGSRSSGADQPVEEAVGHRVDGSNETVNIDPLLHSNKDPIWDIGKDEALRLFRIYEEEVGVMYPLLNVDAVQRHATPFFTFVEAAVRNGLAQRNMPGADAMYDEDMDVLKLVLAIAMLCNVSVHSPMATRLFDSVQKSAESRFLGPVNLKGIRVMVLTAIYHFHSDNEALSWRVIGLTARLCIEQGLHLRQTYDTLFGADDRERDSALKLFWVVYVLDRRWSFGTGLSFAMQAADIDPLLQKPTGSSPYLAAMIDLSHIGTQVWKAISRSESTGDSPKKMSLEDVKYLDYQIIQWYQKIPDSLRYYHPFSSDDAQSMKQQSPAAAAANQIGGRAMYRLRLLLYLRKNQMRIMVHRPVLAAINAKSTASSLTLAQSIVDVAKDTVRVLSHLNNTSDIYKTAQMCFNYFLLSAIGVLFLVVTRFAPTFSDSCRKEFCMAIDLVRELSVDSYTSKRLWQNLQALKEEAPTSRLNASADRHSSALGNDAGATAALPPTITRGAPVATSLARRASHHVQQHDAHSSAAMAMAGLAGHPVDESVFYGKSQARANVAAGVPMSLMLENSAPLPRSPRVSAGEVGLATSPNGIANELMTLYEAAGGHMSGGDVAGHDLAEYAESGADEMAQWTNGIGVGAGMAWGSEEDMSRVMRNLF